MDVLVHFPALHKGFFDAHVKNIILSPTRYLPFYYTISAFFSVSSRLLCIFYYFNVFFSFCRFFCVFSCARLGGGLFFTTGSFESQRRAAGKSPFVYSCVCLAEYCSQRLVSFLTGEKYNGLLGDARK